MFPSSTQTTQTGQVESSVNQTLAYPIEASSLQIDFVKNNSIVIVVVVVDDVVFWLVDA